MNLDAGVARSQIVNVFSGQVPTLKRVDPYHPGDSYLLEKLKEVSTVRRLSRMPEGGPYLTAGEIEAISRWIDDGAPDN